MDKQPEPGAWTNGKNPDAKKPAPVKTKPASKKKTK